MGSATTSEATGCAWDQASDEGAADDRRWVPQGCIGWSDGACCVEMACRPVRPAVWGWGGKTGEMGRSGSRPAGARRPGCLTPLRPLRILLPSGRSVVGNAFSGLLRPTGRRWMSGERSSAGVSGFPRQRRSKSPACGLVGGCSAKARRQAQARLSGVFPAQRFIPWLQGAVACRRHGGAWAARGFGTVRGSGPRAPGFLGRGDRDGGDSCRMVFGACRVGSTRSGSQLQQVWRGPWAGVGFGSSRQSGGSKRRADRDVRFHESSVSWAIGRRTTASGHSNGGVASGGVADRQRETHGFGKVWIA